MSEPAAAEAAELANRVVIDARIAEVSAPRYTPAGVPVQELQLAHQSQRDEAGQRRSVSVQIKAVAFGAVAEQLARQPMGQMMRLDGFLAAPRGGRHQVLHIQRFQVH